MKKAILVGLLVALLVGACGSVATQEPVASPSATVIETKTFYFLAGNNQDPFYIPGVAGFMDAAKELGVKAEFVGPMDANTAEQMKTFETLASSKQTGGIFWYPMDFNAGQPFIEKAFENGIPVVIGAADSPFKAPRAGFIGYDNTVLGTQAGAWVANILDCKGEVGVISNVGPNVLQRGDAFYAYLKATCPEIKLVDRITHDQSAQGATTVIDAYLVANPGLSLVWFADGLAGQMSEVWKTKQAQGITTLFLATDMPPATLEAIKSGVFYGTVGQDTYIEEYWGLKLLYAAANGQRIPDTTFLGALLLDKSNVEDFIE
jgi:ABC-type sugar transport system substrate-binding protein